MKGSLLGQSTVATCHIPNTNITSQWHWIGSPKGVARTLLEGKTAELWTIPAFEACFKCHHSTDR
jgi:hypothetical protein